MEWIQVGGGGTPGVDDAMQEAVANGFGQALQTVIPILALLLVVRVLAGMIKRSRQATRKAEKEEARASARSLRRPAPRPARDRLDVTSDQMRAVADSGYERKPLLNREEARLLPVLERAAKEAGPGIRVMAQVSLGEVIRPVGRDNGAALAAINAKRLDFAVIDRRGMILCAVEHQGSGHHQGHAFARDAVKREALRKAGVRVIETGLDVTEDALRRQVLDLLGAPPCSPGNNGGIEQTARP